MPIEYYANLFFDNLHLVVFAIIILSLFLGSYFRRKRMDKLRAIAQELGLEFKQAGFLQEADIEKEAAKNPRQDYDKMKNVLPVLNVIGNLSGAWAIRGTLNQVLIEIFPYKVGKNNHYTVFRAHLNKPYNFKFEVSKENIVLKMLSGVGILQDVKTGNPEIDSQFLIKGEDENKVKMLFNNPALTSVLQELVSQYGNAIMKFTNDYLELQFSKVGLDMETYRGIISSLTDKIKAIQA